MKMWRSQKRFFRFQEPVPMGMSWQKFCRGLMVICIFSMVTLLIVAGLFCAGALGYVVGRNTEANRNKRQLAREAKALGK